jgi:hypothetical protein
VLKSDTSEIFEIFESVDKFNHLDNLTKIDFIILMRENFGKFYNLVDKITMNKLIKLSTKDNKHINYDELFNLIDRLIKFSDNINLIDFVREFFSYDKEQAKEYISEYSIRSSMMYDDKKTIYNLKHNLIIFWLSLTDLNKQRTFEIEEDYFTNKLSKNEFDIVFGLNINKYQIPVIDHFDVYKKNVIKIKKIEDYKNLNMLIEKKNEINKNDKNNNNNNNCAIKVDTIIIDGINLAKYKIEVSFEIKNIKIVNCNITNLDWLHDNIEIIYSNNNCITQLDNLPRSIKIILCADNLINSLDNLPYGLEYLDIHSNEIQSLNNLPPSLKYLKCSNNKIECIDNLPNGLVYLDCSKNKIEKMTKLPDYLENFICKSNKIKFIEEVKLPLGIKILNLSNNYIKYIYSLNSNIKQINLSDNYNIICYDTPNMIENN